MNTTGISASPPVMWRSLPAWFWIIWKHMQLP
jgi:hypothetical protein